MMGGGFELGSGAEGVRVKRMEIIDLASFLCTFGIGALRRFINSPTCPSLIRWLSGHD